MYDKVEGYTKNTRYKCVELGSLHFMKALSQKYLSHSFLIKLFENVTLLSGCLLNGISSSQKPWEFQIFCSFLPFFFPGGEGNKRFFHMF